MENSPRMREDLPDSFLIKRRGLDKVLVLWWCACAGGVVGTVGRGGYALKDAQKTWDFTVGTEMVGFSKGSFVFKWSILVSFFDLLSQDVGAGDDLMFNGLDSSTPWGQ